MSTPAKSEYILLFRGTDWHKGLSPEEIQEVVKQMYAWLDRLSAEGKAKIGKPLFPEGKIVSQKKGRSVADGPFAESKEAIGGFFFRGRESRRGGGNRQRVSRPELWCFGRSEARRARVPYGVGREQRERDTARDGVASFNSSKRDRRVPRGRIARRIEFT